MYTCIKNKNKNKNTKCVLLLKLLLVHLNFFVEDRLLVRVYDPLVLLFVLLAVRGTREVEVHADADR